LGLCQPGTAPERRGIKVLEPAADKLHDIGACVAAAGATSRAVARLNTRAATRRLSARRKGGRAEAGGTPGADSMPHDRASARRAGSSLQSRTVFLCLTRRKHGVEHHVVGAADVVLGDGASKALAFFI